ncbi:MAG: hypothetical protein KAS32_30980 [Candidatus Peribacteraceae bacterium]|nr:hypothetical protein [Candidatus Peribacteraceae bacterium]
MKDVTKHQGTLTVLGRAHNSGTNGNPRFVCRLDERVCHTGIDSPEGYEIPNYADKEVTADIGLHYGTLTVENIKEVTKAPNFRPVNTCPSCKNNKDGVDGLGFSYGACKKHDLETQENSVCDDYTEE